MITKELLKNLIEQLQMRSTTERPFLVGIDGLGGSGKTTFTKVIEQNVITPNSKVITIHLDDHIVERNKRYQTGHEEWYEYYYLQWDVEILLQDLFKALHDCCDTITLPFYNKTTDSISAQQIKIESNAIILIEGVFLQRLEWRNYFDFIIFLDCPSNLRLQRVFKRDTYIGDNNAIGTKYKKRYWPAEKYYLETRTPTQNANLVIGILDSQSF